MQAQSPAPALITFSGSYPPHEPLGRRAREALNANDANSLCSGLEQSTGVFVKHSPWESDALFVEPLNENREPY